MIGLDSFPVATDGRTGGSGTDNYVVDGHDVTVPHPSPNSIGCGTGPRHLAHTDKPGRVRVRG